MVGKKSVYEHYFETNITERTQSQKNLCTYAHTNSKITFARSNYVTSIA
jgi:hypothetical protein